MGSIVSSIRRLLFGWANREFLVFLFFLAVAAVFWLMTTLNESFEQELKIPVRYVNVPRNVVLTSGDTDTLRVTVRDKGISLVTYLYSKHQPTIEIDFSRYARTDGTGMVPGSDLLRMVNAKLPTSAKAIGVKPESAVFYYNNGEMKRVPVAYQGRVEPDKLYYISNVSYSPDSIVVYASPQKLDSIIAVYTEPINNRGFHDTLSVTVPLRKISGVKMVPSNVTVHFNTDMLAETTVDNVPVTGVNMPEGKSLRTFPPRLAVSFVAGVKYSQTITADDFRIEADYNELSSDSTAKCNVRLVKMPKDIHRVRLHMDQVEYVIEETE